MGRLPKFNIPGQVHFVTTRSFQRQPFFEDERCGDVLIDVMGNFRGKGRFYLYGFVFMPDHVHLLLRPRPRVGTTRGTRGTTRGTPEITQDTSLMSTTWVRGVVPNPAENGDYTISEVMHSIKRSASRLINQRYPDIQFKWDSDFYDFNIYSYRKFIEKLNYIHQNPIRAGLVEKATDYKYSSARNYYLGDDSLITIDQFET